MSNPNKTSGDESTSSSQRPAKGERKAKRGRKQATAAKSSSGAGHSTTAQAQAGRRSPPTDSRQNRTRTQTQNQLSASPEPSSADRHSPETHPAHLPPGPLRTSFMPRSATRTRVGPHTTPPNDRPDESHMPTPRASSQAGGRQRPDVAGRVLMVNLQGADASKDTAMTLKCRDILRDVSNFTTQTVSKSQIHYADEDGLVSTLIEHMEKDPIKFFTIEPSRKYHESETKSIWTRLQTHIIEAISEVQFNLAYDKLDAMGFWKEVGFTRQVAQALRRLTACPLYVGPGDNLKHLANPSSTILERYDPEDCARYIDRVRAADKASKDSGQVGPHESVSQVGSEQDSVATETMKGSSTLTDADDPGGKKSTNHVEPDLRLLWNDCLPAYGCPRCAAMEEAKNHAGTKGGNSPKNSHTQICTYTRIGYAADGCCFGLAIHGLKWRPYQVTGRDELTMWVPIDQREDFPHDLRYRDSHESFRSDANMFEISPDARDVGLSNFIRFMLSLTASVVETLVKQEGGMRRALVSPVALRMEGAHAVKITEVSIDAVTPRSDAKPKRKPGEVVGQQDGFGSGEPRWDSGDGTPPSGPGSDEALGGPAPGKPPGDLRPGEATIQGQGRVAGEQTEHLGNPGLRDRQQASTEREAREKADRLQLHTNEETESVDTQSFREERIQKWLGFLDVAP